jgi:hypothetical protein
MNTIGVLARADLKEAGPVVKELVDWLRGRERRACLDEATAALGGPGIESSCHIASGKDMVASTSAASASSPRSPCPSSTGPSRASSTGSSSTRTGGCCGRSSSDGDARPSLPTC